jgi:hypothetical protein
MVSRQGSALYVTYDTTGSDGVYSDNDGTSSTNNATEPENAVYYPGTGFAAKYMTDYDGTVGMGDGELTLHSPYGEIRAPVSTATGEYAPNIDLVWRVIPESVDPETFPSGPATLMFSHLDLSRTSSEVINSDNDDDDDSSGNCEGAGDLVTIYDGHDVLTASVVAVLCGNSLPMTWVSTTSASFAVRWQTDGTANAGSGFSLSYTMEADARWCGQLRRPAVLTAHSMRFTDGSMTESRIRLGTHHPMFTTTKTPVLD